MTLSDTTPAIGQRITIHAEVPARISGNTLYDPSMYVDWTGGACPAGASDARTKAKSDVRHGMGFAVLPENYFNDGTSKSDPVSALVLIEQARQTVCVYGKDGSLADQMVITGTPSFPPGGARNWMLSTAVFNAKSAHSKIQLQLSGLRVTRATFGCDTKRFTMSPSKAKLDASGHLSYSGPVVADNSNNYDAPIPAKFHGRATLKVSGTIGVGQQPPRSPLGPKGKWGSPVEKIRASFSAPGYKVQPSTKPCSGSFSSVMSPTGSGGDGTMPGQGSARMATDPKHPNQQSPDEAGKGESVPTYTPPPDVPPEPVEQPTL